MLALALTFLACCAGFLSATASYPVTQHPNWHLLGPERCGKNAISDRVIGGTKPALGEFPWMVRTGYTKIRKKQPPTPLFFNCGGSLISQMYVLTAGHCVKKLLRDDITILVRLGEYDIKTDVDCDHRGVCAPPVQDIKAAKIIVHEGYKQSPLTNDLSLIRLTRPANLNPYVGPICLPYGPLLRKDYVNAIVEVAGWGTHDMKIKGGSPVLLHADLSIVNGSVCNEHLLATVKIGPGHLCAGGQLGYDSCRGDSGGPLMKPEAVDGDPKYFLLGLTSFGSSKCGSYRPAVYTKVTHYMMWILNHIEP